MLTFGVAGPTAAATVDGRNAAYLRSELVTDFLATGEADEPAQMPFDLGVFYQIVRAVFPQGADMLWTEVSGELPEPSAPAFRFFDVGG
ncbi:hypothetical protein GQ651_08605 [Alphaproteobacteria bacterium GH1-50]|uniref:Uncharacterized protein n=1 Tax=Kangsaoukella pontilimi TaxID=2691042 RepID=A0A7C9ISF0_9RHOB|nr:hypothetical protein [Kangsaoukella pontilimi]MXQ07905.1 hypothetical protein [Kangsaoukella pontilimi]